jgi:hypothetical protein
VAVALPEGAWRTGVIVSGVVVEYLVMCMVKVVVQPDPGLAGKAVRVMPNVFHVHLAAVAVLALVEVLPFVR